MRFKLKSKSQIKLISEKLRRSGKRIVFTNGCFDILHAGHVMYLAKARESGDVLIVGLNSDSSVQKIKGPLRPINPEKARALVLSALQMIDYVVLFSEQTPLNLIKLIKPNVLVKGSDWKVEQIAGAKEVMSWGGRVKRIGLLKGFSTTNTIKKSQKVQ